MSHALARAISLAGHPLPVLSLALLALAAGHGGGRIAPVAAALAVAAALVLGYSAWRVRRGDWRHMDASGAAERLHLNRFLLLTLAAAAVLAALTPAAALAPALALAAGLVLLALLTARWCTLSLHVGFAVYAAALVWPVVPVFGAVLAAAAALLAWSRWQLGRHAPRDLVAGALAGAALGAVAATLRAAGAWQD